MAEQPVILATTTSTYDSGLLDDLVPAFEAAHGHPLHVIAVGSGQAIELGSRGEADVVLAHSPADEQRLVSSGVTGGRALVMHNDYVVLGPPADPADVATATTLDEVMERLATGAADVVSRGDDSGTHALELSLWSRAGIEPHGDWYRQSGQGMGATLQIASETGAYTLADRGTYLTTATQGGLEVLYEDDPALVNLYHVIPITDAAGDRVNAAGGRAFATWLLDEQAQGIIEHHGIAEHGRAVFVPDAGLVTADLAPDG